MFSSMLPSSHWNPLTSPSPCSTARNLRNPSRIASISGDVLKCSTTLPSDVGYGDRADGLVGAPAGSIGGSTPCALHFGIATVLMLWLLRSFRFLPPNHPCSRPPAT